MADRSGPRRLDPAVAAIGAVAAYNVVQNLALSDQAYVPANLSMTAGLIAYARRSGLSFEDMGLDRRRLLGSLALGGGTLAASGLGGAMFARVPAVRRLLLDERARGHDTAEATRRVLVRFPLGTALFEEVAFRGVIDALCRRRLGDRCGRIASALAFGAWHLLPTYRLHPGMAVGGGVRTTPARIGATIAGAVLTGVSSLGLSHLRDRSGSVAAPWVVHGGYLVISYLAARRAWSGTHVPTRRSGTFPSAPGTS